MYDLDERCRSVAAAFSGWLIMSSDEQLAGADKAAVEAELVFFVANRAPDVLFSFDGLKPPRALFGDLETLGWDVPPVPPPPGSAIVWRPDPTTGADHTITSWQVTEFRLIPDTRWTAEAEASMGASTIEVLKKHDVDITAVRGAEKQVD